MADTILLIHGYGCAGDVWAPVAARLRAEGYRVVSPTIRSAVRTVDGPRAGLAGLTLADYVAEMSALTQALAKEDGRKPIVFGHSMGGLIAQKIAEAGHADRLVLFAPASPADARGKPKLSSVFTFLNMALQSKPETRAGKMWKTGFKFGVMNAVPAARHDTLYATMVHDSGQVLADLAWPHKDPNRAAHVDAVKVTVPVLVLAGALDRTTPLEDVRRVGRKYPAADLKIYPNNAHYLIDEPNTMSILDDVIAWLTGKPKSAPAPPPAPAPAPAPEPVKAAEPSPTPAPAPIEPAPTAITPEPKPPKTTAKAPAKPKAAAKPAPAKAAAPKAAPASKAAKAAPAPKPTVAKAPAKTTAPKPAVEKPAAEVAPAAKVTAKTAPKAAAKPKATKTAPAAEASAPKAAPAPKAAKAPPAAKPPAKPKAEAKPAAAKAPAEAVAPKPAAEKPAAKTAPAAKATAKAAPKAVPATKPAAKTAAAAKAPAPAKTAKTPATKSTAKSSPSPKKSV
jgi:alpha-beta hydrolase superfamily lysophospholipase